MPRPALRPLLHRLGLPGLVLAVLLLAEPALTAAEPAAHAAAPKVQSPIVVKQVAPVHPPEMQKKFRNGQAVIECVITDTGAVQDVKVVSASEPEFGQAAADAVQQWEFRPGEKAGQPVVVRLQIPFDFRLTQEQVIEAAVDRPVFVEITDVVIPAREMPSWPTPKNFLVPRYPESLKGSGKYGKAVVSITINKEGKVVNPKLVKATYPEFVLPSLVTAANLQFPPQIMANNERIHVSMDIQFDFKADAAKPKEKPDKK